MVTCYKKSAALQLRDFYLLKKELCNFRIMNHPAIEQLLTCSVCLDRYRSPKLLPCQHTFCQEPCLKGIADKISRNVKCPECRAVHKIPAEGVGGFPSNRTILGFLEIPVERIQTLQGSPSQPCQICGEAKELTSCTHCDKSVCDSCRHLHVEDLKMDLRKIATKLRGAIPKISKALGTLEQKSFSMKQNQEAIKAEVERSFEKLITSLRVREKGLILEAENLMQSELRTLRFKQEHLEFMLASISSHCDCIENHLNDLQRNPLALELVELKTQSKDWTEQVEILGQTEEDQFKLLKFTANHADIHSDTNKYGSVSWANKSPPNRTCRYRVSDAFGQSGTSSTEVLLSQSGNTAAFLPRATGNYLFSGRQARLRHTNLGLVNAQALVTEGLNSERPRLGLPLYGHQLLLLYQLKGAMRCKFGSRGSDLGHFTWPRGVAVTPEGNIVVADSSNHRMFDRECRFLRAFGSYGNSDGEFDCLAGVTVNSQGWIIIADRYNHRIQIFDNEGRFIRKFGQEGAGEGQLSYPWGVATDRLGLIYICDKDNHRVQVFTLDGCYVRKFGQLGNREDQLEHPHYLAFSPEQKIVISDSGNHRIVVYDKDGRFLLKIGSEGTATGQFKYPRGVAVDSKGNIIVGDSGNNRIQIFHRDGTFLKSFGSWGTGDGQLKGLEGLAFQNGNIIVSDRENHRIQMF
ncbi:UNVERIFIED_CONTAM: hypothetical protein FKN15_041815 [Acipenser sinensis]